MRIVRTVTNHADGGNQMTRENDLDLIRKVRTLHISRRGFLGAGAAVAGASLLGSTGALASGIGGTATRGGRRQDVKPGGILKIATSTDPVGLDPMISSA